VLEDFVPRRFLLFVLQRSNSRELLLVIGRLETTGPDGRDACPRPVLLRPLPVQAGPVPNCFAPKTDVALRPVPR